MAAAMKHMALNFAKLEKFKGVNFQRWQKKMHFSLSNMSVVYVLTTPMHEDGCDNPTVKQVRKRAKWDNDDYVCGGLILNGMSDSLFDIYQNVETSKELWDTLEAKYMAEDVSSKKFLVCNFTNYKMTDSRPVLEQYNELFGILGRFTQHKMNMDESIQVSCIIDKLPPSWKDFKHTLKHLKEELTLVELGSHLHIEESLRVQENDKPNGNNVDCPSVVYMVEHNNSFSKANGSGTKGLVDGSSNSLKAFMSTFRLNDSIIWHARLSYVHFKRMQDMSKDGLIPAFDMDIKKCKTYMLTKITKKQFQIVKRKTKVLELIHNDLRDMHATPSLEMYFVTFIDDAFRFCYVYLLHSKDEALDKFKDDPKIFDEAMKSHDVAFWKKAINDEIDSIMDSNTWVLVDLPSCYKPLGCKWIFKRKLKVDLTKEFLSLRFSMKDMGETDVVVGIRINHESNGIAISQSHYIEKVLKKFNYFDCTPVSTLMDTSEKLMPNNGQAVSQLKYSRVIGFLMYAITCIRPDIRFVAGKLSRCTSNLDTQCWQAIQKASKKQTFITGSTIESEFMALAVASKEAEWLKNLLLEIPLWSKPIASIFIRCDNAATLAKAYSQMYNGKSRHLGAFKSLKTCMYLPSGFSSYLVMGLEVWRVHLEVTEHPDSDSGKREFKH
nr:zinc finger, CCHC-type [Tanacetum cinerariifolium]